MTRVATTIVGERFTHKELWRIVVRQLEHGRTIRQGAFYDDLVAMVFAFHALEAYLNYIGEHLAPAIWKDERNFFRNEPFRGFDGKIRKVFELVGLSEPARNVRPYSSVWLLKDLRDLIGHGKVERVATIVEHEVDEPQPWMKTKLDSFVTEENAQMAHDDVKAIGQLIHDAAYPKVRDIWFGRLAFEGPLQHSDGSSTIAT